VKTHLKDYIKIFDSKFFTKQQCQLIINSLDESTKATHAFYEAGTQKKCNKGNDPQVCRLQDEKRESVGNLIQDQWYKIIAAYIIDWVEKKEKMKWFKGWTGYSFPKFIEYNKGTLMTKHCDHIYDLFEVSGKSRGIPILSIITALNENYSGGEIIMCEKYKYKLKTGETLIFPSNFLYPHEIKRITKGTRHSMVSWVY
jgi:predicted 2-oxoglutarate/Fe(II)-dependent dioxygenase YbiX